MEKNHVHEAQGEKINMISLCCMQQRNFPFKPANTYTKHWYPLVWLMHHDGCCPMADLLAPARA